MANGDIMLEELRELAKSSKSVTTRLTLAALSDTWQQTKGLHGRLESMAAVTEANTELLKTISDAVRESGKKSDDDREQMRSMITDAIKDISAITETVKGVQADIKVVQSDVKNLKENPLNIFAAHLKRNPKLFGTIFAVSSIVILVFFTLWDIPVFRVWVFGVLGIPQDIVNIIPQ